MKTRSQSQTTVDRLSNLPKEILHKILSEFEIAEVCRTSILSKTWREYWISHPSLNFVSHILPSRAKKFKNVIPSLIDNSHFLPSEAKKFEDSISSVLMLHQSPRINTFNVLSKGSCKESNSNIDSWVDFALEKSVEEFYLNFRNSTFKSLAPSQPLFLSQTLRVLHLGFNIKGSHRVKFPRPASIKLPRLEKLRFVGMADISTRFLAAFFSGCPSIETLEVVRCTLEYDGLRILSDQLKKLLLAKCDKYREGVLKSSARFEVSAPNLVSFTCKDHMPNTYDLQGLSSLETADLDIPRSYSDIFLVRVHDEYVVRMIKCLEGVSDVKFLTLSGPSLKAISGFMNSKKRPPLVFAKLRKLTVTTGFYVECLLAIAYVL